ncbi:MAG: ribonuclease P protein component [Oscillospiraceae bacterium]|nr:ribonuclease P protein component [Oscillospiraceae bacterium]
MQFTDTLKKNHEFRRLYSKGSSTAAPCLVLYCRKTRSPRSRIGFTVSNKIGNAVVRNRVRRRLREIYRLHEAEFRPGHDIVVVARMRASGADYHRLEREFLRCADRLGLRTVEVDSK